MDVQMQNGAAAPQNEEQKNIVGNDVVFADVNVPAEVSQEIAEKIKELKEKFGVKKVFVIV
nr:hypothetical protein [Prevotella sp.]